MALTYRTILLRERSMREDISGQQVTLQKIPLKSGTIGFLFSYATNTAYDSLELHDDYRGGCYLVNRQTAGYKRRMNKKILEDGDVGSENVMCKEAISQFMHPFLDMPTFSDILVSNSSTSFIRLLAKFHRNPTGKLKLELLSQITCDGDEELCVPSFKISSNATVPNNRKDCIENRANISVFSYILVTAESDEDDGSRGADTVVQVMAIVHLGYRVIEDHQQKLGTVVLIVAWMKHHSNNENFLPYETLSYDFDKNDLNFSVVTLDMIRQPVCVIPEFSATQTIYSQMTFKDRTMYTKENRRSNPPVQYKPPVASTWRFLLVPYYNPVYANANIAVVSSARQVASDSVNRGATSLNSLVLDKQSLQLLNSAAMDIDKLHITTDLDSEIHSNRSSLISEFSSYEEDEEVYDENED